MRAGWEIRTLGEVCEIYQPKTLSAKDLDESGQYFVYGANGIIGKYTKYNHEDSEVILTCRGSTCGTINVSLPFSWINGNAMVVRPKDKVILKEYLKYLLRGIDYSKVITGAAQPQITREKLAPSVISFPKSTTEQQRIVDILDQEFAKIDALKANAEKSLQAAKDLFQATLKKELEPKEGWKTNTLSSIGKTATGTTPSTSHKEYYGDFIPFIKPADINIDGKGGLCYSNEGLSEEGANNGRVFQENSILMVCIGASIGKVGYALYPVSSNQQINILTPSKEYHWKFLYYCMASPDFQHKVIKEGESAKATLPIINKSKWERLTITTPNITEQVKIIAHLDGLNDKCSKLQENYQKTFALCDDLKQSLLRKAFNGEL